jgi:cellobiose-specific phosphotransferase system component IIA
MTQQFKALRIAQELDITAEEIRRDTLSRWENPDEQMNEAADELRRLHAINTQLLEALKNLLTSDYSAEAERFARAAIASARGQP